ncbi:hypothetical protein B0J13DRAFT_452485 [Dactylonectria estremocensis]|uniref:Uncharacterized protein n=1 Tax=Dactylonectria estremocensis TaxID=1079267 RepID=A0A9P9ISU4_9HYPO|nr:hypothetical protein B0J13DRAFT_452485 [Dactylonectria estremocensis]
MALEQTITIVNNSGKIIKTGKQLFSIFKEAQGNYKEKKSQIRSEKLQRSQTFQNDKPAPRAIPEPPRYYQDDEQYYYDQHARRRSYDAGSERGSERSHRSRSVASRRHRDTRDARDWDTRSRLTEGNLKTLSEVSSVAPSRAPVPRAYQSPYAETMAISKRDLNHIEMRSAMGASTRDMVPRTRSATELSMSKPRKEIDMNLAYGNVPPDLEFRTDLDPHGPDEREATSLIHRVEGLLDEAKCVHHSATATMTHLQKDPDAAAAVALSLAELSSLVKKTSPAFLMLMKSASPAVFSLLASPHFLIGSSIAVGVTVVCFGGWKIVQRLKEQQAAREALAFEGVPMNRPAPMRTQSEYSAGVDEALIIDDDLSSIDTWRRGIVPYGEVGSADFELITPTADRVTKEMYGKDDFDVRSRRSTRTSKTSKTSKTHESHRSHRSHRSSRDDRDRDDSDRRSRRTESIADSERSDRSDRSHRSSKRREKVEMKAIEDGRSRRGDNESEVSIRPKAPHRQSSNMLKALFKNKKEREMVLA